MRTVYRGLCPNCGGDISDEELLTNGVCGKCVPFRASNRTEVHTYLIRTGRLRDFKEALELSIKVEEFRDLFRRLVGSSPWSLQETWARRVFLGRSFSIVAPTGLGKTTFGIVTAIYLHLNSGIKSYLILPSSLLVQHVHDKFEEYLRRLGREIRVVSYRSGLSESRAAEVLSSIGSGDFDVLITTDRFLYNRFDLLRGKEVDYVFVDDVDSFLRSPRNIDKVVELMGYDPGVVETVLKMIRLSRKRRPTEEDFREYESLGEELERYKRTERRKVLIVSGATARARRTMRVRVFRELFGFEPGHTFELVRNIGLYHLRPRRPVKEEVVELVKRHGGGALVFVPQTAGVEGAEELAKALKEEGIPCYAYNRFSPRMLQRFVSGEYEVLLGVASTRSPLARGIDLPERIRYVVFAGVPRREIAIGRDEYRPQMLLSVLKHVAPLLDGPLAEEALRVTGALSRVVPTVSEVVERVGAAIQSGTKLEGFEGHVQELVMRARDLLSRVMTPDRVALLSSRADIQLKVTEEGYSLIIPDVDGFIQASGRCSRLYAGGITRGVAIVLVDDEKAFHGFTKRLESLYDETLEPYDERKVSEDFKLVDEDRRKVALVRSGQVEPGKFDVMRNALVIVESPTKARTIASFFGRPARREIGELTAYESVSGQALLTVVASGGHVFDLTTVGGYHGVLQLDSKYVPIYTPILRCLDCGNQFVDYERCPRCGSERIRSKVEVVKALRSLAMEANEVLIATDPDAEGEKIGYDIYCAVRPYNDNVRRLEFHEVTRKALAAALASPRSVKESLVEAQLLRRIEDRWVGFELSRRLQERFGRKTLSAGRVQTPVLGWVVERTLMASKKIPALTVVLEDGLRVEFLNPVDVEEAKALHEKGELFCDVVEVASEVREVRPPPPYTTDSMLRDAWQFFRMGATEAMEAAQTLFESGLITYHRTDSTTVSSAGLNVAKTYIEEKFPGSFRPRTYAKEGAHECIRPTRPIDEKMLSYYVQSGTLTTAARIGRRELALYGMIFRRFIASQMPEARVRYQTVVVRLLGNSVQIERAVEIVEEGFLKVNPLVQVQMPIVPGRRAVKELVHRKVPAARLLTEGEIIAMMKSRGIGRPSTYAKIVRTLYDRNYVIQRAGRMIATKLGKQVYDFLHTTFGDLVSEELTRQLEAKMDEIEEGKANYLEVLNELRSSLAALMSKG
jgi:reverse gyrase